MGKRSTTSCLENPEIDKLIFVLEMKFMLTIYFTFTIILQTKKILTIKLKYSKINKSVKGNGGYYE